MKIGDKIICLESSIYFKKNKIYTIENIYKSLSHGVLYINGCEISDETTTYDITPMIFYEKFSTLKDIRKEKLNKLNNLVV